MPSFLRGPFGEPPSNIKSCAFIGPSIFHDDALFSLSTPLRFDTFLSLFALTHCCHFPFLRLFVSASCSEPSITSLSPGHQSFMMTRFLFLHLFASSLLHYGLLW